MSWRGIHLSEPARLSLRQSRLAIKRENGEELSFAMEDLSYIICDTGQLTATGTLLGACAASGCLVVTTNERHLPNGVLLPFHPYYRQAETVQAQLSLSKPRQKRWWQAIVQRKILNQAACLVLASREAKASTQLERLARSVRSGDPDNIEGQAARVYWQAYQTNFARDPDGEDRCNALLNYGYAVVRAAMARDLAALGFIPCLGIHHCSLQNAFNLADDLIEPWRPFVDDRAFRLHATTKAQKEFDTADRRAMCAVLHEEVLLNGEQHQLLAGIRHYVERFRAAVLGREPQLLFPVFPQRGRSD